MSEKEKDLVIAVDWKWLVLAGYWLFLRPQMLKWGTVRGESQRRLDGDELIPRPNFQMMRAVNIDAPPQAVWPWLAQMGRERTGFYGLDMLINQGIPSVNFVRQDIDPPQVGDKLDGGFELLQLEPERKLLFAAFNHPLLPGLSADISGLYLLERQRDGSTRLLIRFRAFSYSIAGLMFNVALEPTLFWGLGEQTQQLQAHAESMRHLASSAPQAVGSQSVE